MEIGIAFDLRSDFTVADGAPEDRLEEYDSDKTVDAIARALEANGHATRRVFGGERFIHQMMNANRPELVFNIAEGWGTRSREAHVPAVCEMLKVPFTHSDPLTLALTLDKPLTKRVVASFGIPTAPFVVIECLSELSKAAGAASKLASLGGKLDFPLFVKPVAEGSSMGVRKSSRVLDWASLEREVARCLSDYKQPVIVESFLPGVEFTVGVVGNALPGHELEVLGVMEIEPRTVRPEEFVYGLETKRNYEVEVEYHVPPRSVTANKRREVEKVALAAFRALGCRDVARFDIRLDAQGTPNFLEVNPLPGLSPVSGDLVIMGRASGITYEKLIGRIADEAIRRQGLVSKRASLAGASA